MPKRLPRNIENLKPPAEGRVEYWDDPRAAGGVAGLHLRVAASGTKTWAVMYRCGGKIVRETLGPFSATLRVGDARKRAEASIERALEGVNPVAERREAVQQARANTVAVVVERFLKERGEARGWRRSTRYYYGRIFEHRIVPAWGDKPIDRVTTADVLALIKRVRTTRERRGREGGATVQANRVLARAVTFFRWATRQGLVATDPTLNLEPFAEASRDRVLDDAELVALWKATEGPAPECAFLRLCLLTAQRRVEVANLSWREIDLDKAVWTIPADRSKNGKAHIVHLSPQALAVVEALQRDVDRPLGAPIRSPSITKQIDRVRSQMPGVPRWTPHDLRRTATTIMAGLGIAPHVCDKVLNHQPAAIRGVAAIYNRHQYLPERAAALDALGRYVETLVDPSKAANVVEMRRA